MNIKKNFRTKEDLIQFAQNTRGKICELQTSESKMKLIETKERQYDLVELNRIGFYTNMKGEKFTFGTYQEAYDNVIKTFESKNKDKFLSAVSILELLARSKYKKPVYIEFTQNKASDDLEISIFNQYVMSYIQNDIKYELCVKY